MFKYYELNDAPEESTLLMKQALKNFGMIPNLHRILAEAPITYDAYNDLFLKFFKGSSFSPIEVQIVFMTVNYKNSCHYCMSAHTWIMNLSNEDQDIIKALREGKDLKDTKLHALQTYVRKLLENNGHIGDDNLKSFFDAGYTKKHALEVMCGIASKIISNFTNAIAHTKLDDEIKEYEWSK